MLTRLVAKGAIEHEAEGRAYLYRPIVQKADCVRNASESFMKRVFDGALQPILAHFVKEEELSDEELETLQKLLNAKRKK